MEEKKILTDEELDNVVGGASPNKIVVENKGLTPGENVDDIRYFIKCNQKYCLTSRENVDGIRIRDPRGAASKPLRSDQR